MISVALLLAVSVTPDAPGVQYRQPQLAVTKDQVAVTFGSGRASP